MLVRRPHGGPPRRGENVCTDVSLMDVAGALSTLPQLSLTDTSGSDRLKAQGARVLVVWTLKKSEAAQVASVRLRDLTFRLSQLESHLFWLRQAPRWFALASQRTSGLGGKAGSLHYLGSV